MLFIFVDHGQPARVLNVILYPSPQSLMFWDMISLRLFAAQRDHCAVTLSAEREEAARAGMDQASGPDFHPVGHQHSHGDGVSLSGLPGRSYWMTAIHGSALSGFRLCLGPGAADPSLPDFAAG